MPEEVRAYVLRMMSPRRPLPDDFDADALTFDEIMEIVRLSDWKCVDPEPRQFVHWLLHESRFAARWVEYLGNMALHAEHHLCVHLLKNDSIRAAAHKKAKAIRATLAGPASSPVEQLLAERIALCWLGVNVAEAALAAATERSRPGDDSEEVALRRIEARHRMFLTSVRTLGWVRRLAVPALQVNLAHQQVNQQVVTGSDAAGLAARSDGVGPGQGGCT